MICPTCNGEMIVVEHNRVELDYCISCQGVWFDSGELELLMRSMHLENIEPFLNNILDSPETKSSEKRRKCPICNRRMRKTTIGQQPEILIDICRGGDGLWFDGGEVGQLINQLAEKQTEKQGSQQQVISFLGEVFKARE